MPGHQLLELNPPGSLCSNVAAGSGYELMQHLRAKSLDGARVVAR